MLILIIDNTKQFQNVAMMTIFICLMSNGKTKLFAVPQRVSHITETLLSFGVSPTQQL